MNKTSPQITVEIIIHQINRLEITILHQVIISNIIHKEIISSPPVYQDQGQRQNFQGQQHQNYQGGLEPE